MTSSPSIDGVLVQWGERLFYPGSRIVKPLPTPRLDTMTRRKAAVIRQRIEATVVRRAPRDHSIDGHAGPAARCITSAGRQCQRRVRLATPGLRMPVAASGCGRQ